MEKPDINALLKSILPNGVDFGASADKDADDRTSLQTMLEGIVSGKLAFLMVVGDDGTIDWHSWNADRLQLIQHLARWIRRTAEEMEKKP